MLLPDTSRPMVLPCRADDLTDDPEHRARRPPLTTGHAHATLDSVQDPDSLAPIEQADAQDPRHACPPPLFKRPVTIPTRTRSTAPAWCTSV